MNSGKLFHESNILRAISRSDAPKKDQHRHGIFMHDRHNYPAYSPQTFSSSLTAASASSAKSNVPIHYSPARQIGAFAGKIQSPFFFNNDSRAANGW